MRFPKFVELELRISEPCADYFRRVPYSLVECIWREGLNTACGAPFCCCDYDVLYYPRMPVVRPVPKLRREHTGPIELTVKLGPAPGEPWGLVR